jgi:hypothetical protein
VIDGGGHFITGNPKPGQADKLISLTRCENLVVNGITLRRGGHFAMLTNACNHIRSDHLIIDTASDRDGWNVINAKDVRITNAKFAANDDALAFKSDWALGETIDNGDVVVKNAQLSARCCNALMFGSETCGDFSHYRFSDITITGAGKSGMGMVSMDGARITDVRYNNINISGPTSPLLVKVGTRRRCGDSPGIGNISNIHYSNITSVGTGTNTPTIWGQPGHEISDITFRNVHLTLPGGRPAMDPNLVPTDNGHYDPNAWTVRPSYGLYLHHVDGIRFIDSSLSFAADDARPAVIANTGRAVNLRGLTVRRGTGSPFDVGFQSVDRYCLMEGRTTENATPRLSTPDSKPACTGGIANFSLRATPPTLAGAAGSTVHYKVRTAATTGTPDPITLTATGAPPGAQVTFSPATVQPGDSATMAVSIPAGTRNATYALTAIGTNSTATQYAKVSLVTKGGVDLNITDLTVNDPENAADWSIQSNLRKGVQLFADRFFTVASVDHSMEGARWIRTANDSRTATANPLVTFNLTAPATVLVAIDSRSPRPAWLDSTWVDSGTYLYDWEGLTSYRRFPAYAKQFPAGPVSLGPPMVGTSPANMYTIVVI